MSICLLWEITNFLNFWEISIIVLGKFYDFVYEGEVYVSVDVTGYHAVVD